MICYGDTAVFSIRAIGEDDYLYFWYKVGNDVCLGRQNVLMLPDCDGTTDGKYFCKVTDLTERIVRYSDTAEVDVKKYPTVVISTSPSTSLICAGNDVTLDASASENGKIPGDTYAYNWAGNDMKSGQDAAIAVAAPVENGIYTVTVSNGGCARSATVDVQVNHSEIGMMPVVYGGAGQKMKLVPLRVTSGSILTWWVDGVSKGIGNSLGIVPVAGTSVVTVQADYNGCKAVDTCRVIAKTQMAFRGNTDDGYTESFKNYSINKVVYPGEVCEGSEASFGVKGYGFDKYLYYWYKYPGKNHIATGEVFTIPATELADSGCYYCKILNAQSKDYVYSDTVSLRVAAMPTAWINDPVSPAEICAGSPIDLDASVSEIGKPAGDTYVYQWAGRDILTRSDRSRVTVQPAVSGRYVVNVGNRGCFDSVSVQVIVNNPQVDIPSALFMAAGDRLELEPEVIAGARLTWWADGVNQGEKNLYEINPLVNPVNIKVEVNINGCKAYDSCRVELKGSKAYAGEKQDGYSESSLSFSVPAVIYTKDICEKDSAVFQVRVADKEQYLYYWYKYPDLAIVGNGSILVIGSAVLADSGKYYCRITDVKGTVERYSDTVTLQVHKMPVAHIALPADGTVVCAGESILLDGSGSELENLFLDKYRYEWAGPSIEEPRDTSKINVSPLKDAAYILTVGNGSCVAFDTVEIVVSTPRIDLPEMIYATGGSRQEFKPEIPGGATVRWWVDGVETSTGYPFVIDPITTGTTVRVEMTVDGCRATDSCVVKTKAGIANEGGDDDGYTESMNPFEVNQIVYPGEVCQGQDVAFGAKGYGMQLYQYFWYRYPADEVIAYGAVFEIHNAQLADTGRYYCIVSDANSRETISTDTVYLGVNRIPQAKISSPLSPDTVCYGETIELNGAETELDRQGDEVYRYLWNGAGILPVDTLMNVTVQPEISGEYILSVNNRGCIGRDTLVVQVNRPVVEIPSYQLVAGNSRLEVVPETNAGGELTWWVDGASKGIMNPFVLDPVSRSFELKVQLDALGCRVTDFGYVEVNTKGAYTGDKQDGYSESMNSFSTSKITYEEEICEGAVSTFGVKAVGEGAYLYTWFKYPEDRKVAEGELFVISPTNLSDSGRYYCMITDIKGVDTLYSDTVSFMVRRNPVAAFTSPGSPDTVCYGETIVLDASATEDNNTGRDIYEYKWAGMDIVGRDDSVKILVRPPFSGSYTLTVSNGKCTDFGMIDIVVNSPEVDIPSSIYVTAGGSYEFKPQTGGGTNLKWFVDGEEKGTGKTFVFNSGTKEAVVRVELAERGCVAADSCLVYVKSAGAYKGGFEDGYTESFVQFKLAKVKHSSFICAGEKAEFSVQVSGLGGYLYYWRKLPDNKICSRQKDFVIPNVTVADSGRYYCVIKDLRGQDSLYSDTVTMNVRRTPAVVVAAPADYTKICKGDVVRLDAGSSENGKLPGDIFSYKWMGEQLVSRYDSVVVEAAPMRSGSYIVMVGNDGCIGFDTVHLVVEPLHFVLPPVIWVNKGDTLALSPEIPPGAEVEWFVDGVSHGKMHPFTLPSVTAPLTVSAVMSLNGCTAEAGCQVKIREGYIYQGGLQDGFVGSGLSFYLRIDGPEYICAGEKVLFRSFIKGDGAFEYAWKKVGGSKVLSTADRFEIMPVALADSGGYYCVGWNIYTSDTAYSDTIHMAVYATPVPVISLPADYAKICKGTAVQLHARGSEAGKRPDDTYRYSWIGEQLVSRYDSAIVQAVPMKSGTYIVMVNNGGCVAFDTVHLVVEPLYLALPPVVWIGKGEPLALSPEIPPGAEIEWFVDGASHGKMYPFILSSVTAPLTVSAVMSLNGCTVEAECQVKIREEYIYQGGLQDGFVNAEMGMECGAMFVPDSVLLCLGDTADVRIRLVSGDKPWRFNYLDPAGTEFEIRDITDSVYTIRLSKFGVYKIIGMGDTKGCHCEKILDTLEVIHRQPDRIKFNKKPLEYVGLCLDVDLRDSLKPMMNDTLMIRAGEFFVNGVGLGSGDLWRAEDMRGDSCYLIKCEYRDSSSCVAASDEIRICADSVYGVVLNVPDYICEGTIDTLKLKLFSAREQRFSVKYNEHHYRVGGKRTTVTNQAVVPAINRGTFEKPVVWSANGISTDSCIVFEFTEIWDSHNCLVDSVFRDTVWLRRHPKLDILTRYPAGAAWERGRDTVIISGSRDSVSVWAALLAGDTPWKLGRHYINAEGNGSIADTLSVTEADTIFWLHDRGIYTFQAIDSVCGLVGDPAVLAVLYPDTVYIRGSVWLEGAYREALGHMQSKISAELLQYYGITAWPAVPVGTDVIDLVFLQFRTGSERDSVALLRGDSRLVATDTCLVLSDGRLADWRTGDTIVGLPDISGWRSSNFYVVVKHRNHLDVMSARAYRLSNITDKAVKLDFTKIRNVYCSDGELDNHMNLVDGKWMLSAGEVNNNRLISIYDPNDVVRMYRKGSLPLNVRVHYDLNFDGVVNWPGWNRTDDSKDWSLVKKNRGKFTEVK